MPTSVVFDDSQISYTYDSLDRVISKNVNDLYTINYGYKHYGKRTTNIIENYSINNNTYKYLYDTNGNIIKVYYNNNLINEYEYDIDSQLTKEIDHSNNKYIEYIYNGSGNMVSKCEKNLLNDNIISQHTLTYTNTNWEDQLTNYDGETITYDSIGNVIGVGNVTLSWKNGKELASYINLDNSTSAVYQYNLDGIRISKNVNNVETKYYLDGNNIVMEKTGNQIIYFLYDLDGIIGMNYNGNNYFYLKNRSNDIIGLVDEQGIIVASYTYDSWGNILSIKDSNNNNITDASNVAIINPFRYRSYYYDRESNLYYLNTRYYNAKWGKFISPDSVIGANQDILANNLYLYVSNNPVNGLDSNGNILLTLIVVGIILSATKKSKKNKKKQKATKAKSKNNNNNKNIIKGTVSYDKKKAIPIVNSVARTAYIDYSKESGIHTTSPIVNSDGPLGVDFEFNPANIFDSTISLSLSTSFGTITKTNGFYDNSIQFQSNWRNKGNKRKRNSYKFGKDKISYYAEAGTDFFASKDVYNYDYDRLTVSKIMIALTILAPEVVGSLGQVKLINMGDKAVPAVIRYASALG